MKPARTHKPFPNYPTPIDQRDERSLHRWVKHEPRCDNPCQFCDGGLSACVDCGGLEGSLTTQCPGIELSADLLDHIYAQSMDFNQNRWWISFDVAWAPIRGAANLLSELLPLLDTDSWT